MHRLLLVVGCFALGCSTDPTDPSAGSAHTAAGSANTAAPAAPLDPAAVAAEVPTEFKEKLLFEVREVSAVLGSRKEVYSVVAPKGWEPGDMEMFAKLRPEPSEDFGNMTELQLATNCDGACVAKDWASVAEKVEFAQFREATFKILKDEKTESSHLLVAASGDSATYYVRRAWWGKGQDRYFTCSATLSKGFGPDAPDLRKLIPAFEKVCQSVGYKQQRTDGR